MINVIAFMIFGAALFVWADVGSSMQNDGCWSFKTNMLNWAWWVGMFIYMVFWPIIIGTAFIEANRRIRGISG